ncbi:MAG: hypothetical protein ACRDP7_47900, partial [Trebonia sp.]
MKHRKGKAWLAVPLFTATAALAAGLAAPPAHAQPRDDGGWQSYQEQPAHANVKPTSATVLSGNVVNASGLAGRGRGNTTLTVTAGGPPATVLLDYGVEVEGSPYVTVASYSGGTPAVSLAFSESKTYLRTPGASTLATAVAAWATSVTVKAGTSGSPLAFADGDKVTIGSPAETDTITSVSGAALTLKSPLADAHPAGGTVTSTPGAVTGDSAFQAREVSLPITSGTTLASGFMGGLRFEAITLSTPGTI